VSEVPASDVCIGNNVAVSLNTQSSIEAVFHLSDPLYDAAAPRIYAARFWAWGRGGGVAAHRSAIDANRPEEPNHL